MRVVARSAVVGLVVLAAVLGGVGGGLGGVDGDLGGVGPASAATAHDGQQPTVSVGSPGGAVTEGATSLGDAPPAQTVYTVTITQEFSRLPDHPGQVQVTRRVNIPETVRSLRTTLPERATVLRTSAGFEAIGGRQYEWDGGASTATITYRLGVNRTGQVSGPEDTGGRFLFADVGDWALFQRPAAPVDVSYRGGTALEFERQTAVDGPGAAGKALVYLGEMASTTRQAHGQQFKLVVPAAASLRESQENIFESVTAASDALRVGDRDEEVLMVAAPTTIDWSVRGLRAGDSDFYVTANQRVDDPDNVWVHEYVHTRQDFSLGTETKWLGEATATYYAALLTLRQERVTFEEFRRVLSLGANGEYDSVVLANPDTWTRGATYQKGGLVVGELDRRLRLATDSQSDFQAIFRELNERRESLSGEAFRSIVRDHGTAEVASVARRYTTTTEAPSIWDRAAHQAAFGALPPRIRVSLPQDEPDLEARVSGPYRTVAIDGPPYAIVANETLTLDVQIANDGGRTGEYNLTYGLADGDRRYLSGSVDPGAPVTETVAVTPSEPGEQTVRVGEYDVPVSVLRPAQLEVTSLRANRSQVAVGGAVGLEVALQNPTDRPGRREIVLSVDGEPAANRTVILGAGESRTVNLTLRLADAGDHEISVANGSVTVTATDGIAGDAGPGFGVLSLAVALLVLVGYGLVRRTD